MAEVECTKGSNDAVHMKAKQRYQVHKETELEE
jgi:hypothetical protein